LRPGRHDSINIQRALTYLRGLGDLGGSVRKPGVPPLKCPGGAEGGPGLMPELVPEPKLIAFATHLLQTTLPSTAMEQLSHSHSPHRQQVLNACASG